MTKLNVSWQSTYGRLWNLLATNRALNQSSVSSGLCLMRKTHLLPRRLYYGLGGIDFITNFVAPMRIMMCLDHCCGYDVTQPHGDNQRELNVGLDNIFLGTCDHLMSVQRHNFSLCRWCRRQWRLIILQNRNWMISGIMCVHGFWWCDWRQGIRRCVGRWCNTPDHYLTGNAIIFALRHLFWGSQNKFGDPIPNVQAHVPTEHNFKAFPPEMHFVVSSSGQGLISYENQSNFSQTLH